MKLRIGVAAYILICGVLAWYLGHAWFPHITTGYLLEDFIGWLIALVFIEVFVWAGIEMYDDGGLR